MAPASAAPPALPPSVEEAYRRKCIQLKQRTSEVEEANDAARLRLARLKRQVEKMRLERAFLLEQLAKRTSTNVEDSDGSPSPPPTPKEKPLRIKRGHRKPSMLTSFETPPAGTASSVVGGNDQPSLGRSGGNAFPSQNSLRQTHSPSSDAFSAQPGDGRPKTNGVRLGAPPQKPGSAFELYCDETRAGLKDAENDAGDDKDRAEELEQSWKDLGQSQREQFEARAESQMAQYQKDKDAYDEAQAAAKKSGDADSGATEEVEMDVDEAETHGGSAGAKRAGDDVEMGSYDTDQETQGEKPEE